MQLFDSHCHLDHSSFDTDRDAVLARCLSVGVTRMLVPAVDARNWEPLLDLCAHHDSLYPALGMHPIYLERHVRSDIEALARAVKTYLPVAIGEIGLDFFIDDPQKQQQQELFEAQLDIAQQADLPVILHCRKAHDQILQTLRTRSVCGGIAHAFNGSLQQAHQYIDLGFKLGFGGMLTYARSNKLRKLAKDLPLDAIVLETDAPDMTVASHRGERNSPEYLPECLAALAEVRQQDPEHVAEQTTRNACDVLRLN